MGVEKTKVLVTVMTYPHPSPGYQELVCTAGITETGEWVRLYPVHYRYLPNIQQFKKYQWIELELNKLENDRDKRKESRKPNVDSIHILGEPLDAKNKWKARRRIIDSMPHHTVNELKQQFDEERVSIGIVRPTKVLDLEIRPADSEWKPEWKSLFTQLRLFGPPQKPLKKLPFTFHYVFECKDSEKPHTAMCEDWELGVLFLKECVRLGTEEKAAESVKKKFLGEMCRHDKDTQFFMGTRFPYNVWLVVGVFWPPRIEQTELFS